MPHRHYAKKISAENVAKGMAAESLFQDWLNASRLPFVYCTQDIASVPEHFKGKLKRPDYFVALPFVGTIAFDAKAKSLYQGAFIFDLAEVERLILFDEIFRITTFFACFDPDNPARCWWFRVRSLSGLDIERRRGVATVSVPVTDGLAVDMAEPLQQALRDVLLLI